MEVLRKYNAATTILFPLIDFGATDYETTPVSHASGDTQISKDEAAFANTTNAFAHEGNGIYSLALTATEMSAARIVVTIKDQSAPKAWIDQTVIIATYGNASAQHEFDLDTASVAQTGDNFARLGAPAGASVSADIAAIEAQTDDIGAAGAGLSAVPWNAAWDAEVQSEVADALAVYDPPTQAELVAEIDAVQTDIAAVQSDTNDIQARLPAALVVGRMDASVGAVAAGAITAAAIATDAIDADALAADAVAEIQSGLATAAAVNTIDDFLDTEVAAILAAVDTEVAAIKAVTDLLTLAGIADAVLQRPLASAEGGATSRSLAWAVAKLVNKVALAGSTLSIKGTDDTTDVFTQTVATSASQDPVISVDTV